MSGAGGVGGSEHRDHREHDEHRDHREHDEHREHREHDERPWGAYTVLDDEQGSHKVKRIVVRPGKRLSYQRHARRAEHWVVVEGSALVTLDGAEIRLGAGQAVDIPRGSAHRMENVGDDDVVFVEVQLGDYFGEDDIVRLEDDFGRAGTSGRPVPDEHPAGS